jgi:hypothetical protein
VVRLGLVPGILVLVGLMASATSLRAAEPDPRGKPEGMKAGDTVRWYVWHDGDGWHVRTTTKKALHEFTGTMRVINGQVTGVNLAKIENAGATKDWWRLSEGNKVVTLDLRTDGGMDGFDFQVGDKANQIEFTLFIDGKEKKDLIFVGKNAANPSAANFVLPAHP